MTQKTYMAAVEVFGEARKAPSPPWDGQDEYGGGGVLGVRFWGTMGGLSSSGAREDSYGMGGHGQYKGGEKKEKTWYKAIQRRVKSTKI